MATQKEVSTLITIPKKTLSEALNSCARVTPTKPSDLGYHFITVKLSDGIVTLTSTDGEIDLQASVPCTAAIGAEGFSASVPAHEFTSIVANSPNETVNLLKEGPQIRVVAGKYKAKVMTSEVPEEHKNITFAEKLVNAYPAKELKNIIKLVKHATAKEEFQAIFRGIYFNSEGSEVVTTDGFRLARYKLNSEMSFLKSQGVVIPASHCEVLERVLEDGEVKIGQEEYKVTFRTDSYSLNLRIMEGSYPDYDRVIPKEFLGELVCDSSELLATVNRISISADKSTNSRIDLHVDGAISISAEGGISQGQEELEAEVNWLGTIEEIDIAFNSKYLLDLIKLHKGEMKLSISGKTTPSVITFTDEPDFMAMVVPLRVD